MRRYNVCVSLPDMAKRTAGKRFQRTPAVPDLEAAQARIARYQRAQDGPEATAAAIAGLRADLDRLEVAQVERLRREGFTWERLGRAYGVTGAGLAGRIRRIATRSGDGERPWLDAIPRPSRRGSTTEGDGGASL